MRVLVVHEVEFIDKVVYEWQEFPEVLQARGHDVRVVDYDMRSGWNDVRRWGLGPKRMTTPWRLDPSSETELLRMIGPPPAALRRLFAAASSPLTMRRVMAEVRPDVVLLYAVPTCGPAVVSAAREAGCPVVFRSIDVLSELVPRALAFGVHWLERRVYAGCDRILVANPRLNDYVDTMSRRTATTSLMLSPVDTAMRFVPGADSRAETRARLAIPTDAPVAIFVGSLFGFNGLDRIIDAWVEVEASAPGSHLLIVGGGPDEQRLRHLAANRGVDALVRFTGMVHYDDVPELIRAADVGLCPFEVLPVTRDVNPIKIMQYLACAVPCVCTPLEGTVRVLPDRESGVAYADEGEPYVALLTELLGDPERARDAGRTGREWVVAHHSYERIAEQLEFELSDVIATHRERAR